MVQICGKCLKYLRNYLDIWEMAYIVQKRLKYEGYDLDVLELAETCGK